MSHPILSVNQKVFKPKSKTISMERNTLYLLASMSDKPDKRVAHGRELLNSALKTEGSLKYVLTDINNPNSCGLIADWCHRSSSDYINFESEPSCGSSSVLVDSDKGKIGYGLVNSFSDVLRLVKWGPAKDSNESFAFLTEGSEERLIALSKLARANDLITKVNINYNGF